MSDNYKWCCVVCSVVIAHVEHELYLHVYTKCTQSALITGLLKGLGHLLQFKRCDLLIFVQTELLA